jgi:hypothetical protein
MKSYSGNFGQPGRSDNDLNTLSMFQSLGLRENDGTPKPALKVWMGFREGR